MEHLARKLFGELGLTDRFYTIIGGDTRWGDGKSLPPDLLHLMVERSALMRRAPPISATPISTRARRRRPKIPCVICRWLQSGTDRPPWRGCGD
jgi:phosphoglycolate phosphatase